MNDCMALTASGEIPTLLAMAHWKGNAEAVTALVYLNIAALDEYLHLNNRLSEDEVEYIATEIVETYGGALSFADLNLIITNAKRGVYGKFYERLSSVDILSWVSDYYDRRLAEAATVNDMERDSREPRMRDKMINSKDFEFQLFKEKLSKNNEKNNV